MSDDSQAPGEISNEFLMLCSRLRTETMLWLGLIANPQTEETTVDLEQAKGTIDILEMLRKKTEGNRAVEETKVLQTLLFDLRMLYVEKSREKQS